MEKSISETIILLNDGDIELGFFRFSTSKQSAFNKMMKRIGDDTFEPVYISKDIKGNPREWIVKIPVKYLSKRTFGIGKPRQITLTDEQRKVLSDRAKENFGLPQ